MRKTIYYKDSTFEKWGKYELVSPFFEHVIDLIKWDKKNEKSKL